MMLRALGFSLAQPDNFITDVTFFVWVAMILGGAGRVLGPILGASLFFAVLGFTDSFLREGVENEVIPESVMTGTQVGQVRFMLVGLALILLAAPVTVLAGPSVPPSAAPAAPPTLNSGKHALAFQRAS